MIKKLFLYTFFLSLSLIAQGQGELVPMISTYFGGNQGDWIQGVCQDSDGNYYISGSTISTNLPVTIGAYQSNYSGAGDVFIAKFSPSLNLIWCTYFGGNSLECYPAIIVSDDGYIYLSFYTVSDDLIAPDDTLYQYHGGVDPYIAKFNLDGNFIWGKYFGSGFNENSIALSFSQNSLILSYLRKNMPAYNPIPPSGPYYSYNNLNLFDNFESYSSSGLSYYASVLKLNFDGNCTESISIGFNTSMVANSQRQTLNEKLIFPIGVAGGPQTAYLPDGTSLDQSDRFLQTCFFEFDLDSLELLHYSYSFPVIALNPIRFLQLAENKRYYSMAFTNMYPDAMPPLVGNFGSQLPVNSSSNQIPDGYHQLLDTTETIIWSGNIFASAISAENAVFLDGADIIKLGNAQEIYPYAVNGNFSGSTEDGSVVIFDGAMNLVLSTLFGGSGDDYFYSGMDIGDQTFLAVGSSSSIDYPTTANAFQSQNAGSIDGILTIFKYNHVGIEELTESSSGYRVYPLPAKESVTIELKENEFVNQSKLFNATGSLIDIQSNPSSNQRLTLKTADLLSGLYLVQLYHGNSFVGSVKIVVE